MTFRIFRVAAGQERKRVVPTGLARLRLICVPRGNWVDRGNWRMAVVIMDDAEVTDTDFRNFPIAHNRTRVQGKRQQFCHVRTSVDCQSNPKVPDQPFRLYVFFDFMHTFFFLTFTSNPFPTRFLVKPLSLRSFSYPGSLAARKRYIIFHGDLSELSCSTNGSHVEKWKI